MPVEASKRLIFVDGIRKVLAQVHVSCSLNQQSTDFLDSQLVLFISRVFSTPCTTYSDIKEKCIQILPDELAWWGIKSAEEALETCQPAIRKAQDAKKQFSQPDTLCFPLDFILTDNPFLSQPVELDAAIFLTALVEYLCADILKCASNLATSTSRRTIDLQDIKQTLRLDPHLQELFLRLRCDSALLSLRQSEETLARDLTALLKIFGEALKPLKEQGIPTLLTHISVINEFQKSLTKILADAADSKDISQLAEHILNNKTIFLDYFKEFTKTAKELTEWLQKPPVKKQLEDRGLYRAAEHHLLRFMWRPVTHLADYEYALSQVKDLDLEIETILQQYVPFVEKAREVGQPFGLITEEAEIDWRAQMRRTMDYNELQAKIEGWQGKNICDFDPVLKKEGSLPSITVSNGVKKTKKSKDRIFFLFDKFIVCCKINEFLLGKRSYPYQLKDILTLQTLKIQEVEDDEMKYVIELVKSKDYSLLLGCASEAEKQSWLSALHSALTAAQLSYTLEKVLLQEAIQGPELPPELRLTPEEYRFAVPDTPDNIIFEIGLSNDGIPLIKAATVLKLVERLTYDKYADTNYLKDFLLTYRSFMDPLELLELLIERFRLPTPKNASPEQQEYFKANVRRPVQLRVFNVVKNWVDKHFLDFKESPELRKKLLEFLQDMGSIEGMDKAVQALNKTVKKREEEINENASQDGKNYTAGLCPNPIKLGVTEKIEGLLVLDPLEVARQITLIEFDLYTSIKSFECLNQRWAKKNKEKEAPNILAMIDRFNTVSNWIKTQIVFTEDFNVRVELLERFIKIAEKCMELNNFNGMMEIMSGINSIPVNRLRLTWNALSKKTLSTYNDIMQLMNPEKSYSRFRQVLHTINPPCVPYFGMYLTDLTFIEDGNKDIVPGTDLINFTKRRRAAAVIEEIQRYQQQRYDLEKVEEIQRFLKELSSEDDETCYQKSLEVEPRSLHASSEMDATIVTSLTGSSLSVSSPTVDKNPLNMSRSRSLVEIDDDGQRKSRSGSGAGPSLPPFHRKFSATTANMVRTLSSSKTAAANMIKSMSKLGEGWISSSSSHLGGDKQTPPAISPMNSKTRFFSESDSPPPSDSKPAPPPRPDRPGTSDRSEKVRSVSEPPDVVVSSTGVQIFALRKSDSDDQLKDRSISAPPPVPFRDRSQFQPSDAK